MERPVGSAMEAAVKMQPPRARRRNMPTAAVAGPGTARCRTRLGLQRKAARAALVAAAAFAVTAAAVGACSCYALFSSQQAPLLDGVSTGPAKHPLAASSEAVSVRLLRSKRLRSRREATARVGDSAFRGSSFSSDGGRSASSRQEEARRLFRDILEVVQSAGVTAGAVRSVQAARAVAQTAADLFREGDAPKLFQSLQALVLGVPPSRGDAASRKAEAAESDATVAQWLRRLFERLGPTYIKLGQFIASSPTLFPEAYVKEFQKCLDKTESTAVEVIEKTIEEDLGKPVNVLFKSFNRTPLASASVAQVHEAVLPSGVRVAVKVLKPEVQQAMKADLGFLYIAARVLEFLNPELARSSLADIVGEIRTSMLGEIDLNQERKNLDIFRDFLVERGLTGVAAAPRPFPDFSSKRVLTMERFEGVPLVDLEGIRGYSANPEATLISALNVWALSVRNCEIFHADVHAGNLLVLRDGRVGFIDFGIVGKVPPSIWTAVEDFAVGFVSNDADAMAKAMIAMGATETGCNEAGLATDIEGIISRVNAIEPEVVLRRGQTQDGQDVVQAQLAVDDTQVTELLLDIIRVADQNGLKLPREFALLVKQGLYFDRYNKLLAPDLDPLRDNRVRLGLDGDVYTADKGSAAASGQQTSIDGSVIDI
eukprot:TRINITY_DN47512_c0_g1_i1.p1 TRINITY_DN47512_c0_g1~~TRINITY_DN47512_c0_g1_i1.p1  ORF type:complete len:655 (-),score=168.37 TRINITY_DN47512_c0_g1_i1:200-2164(-)